MVVIMLCTPLCRELGGVLVLTEFLGKTFYVHLGPTLYPNPKVLVYQQA